MHTPPFIPNNTRALQQQNGYPRHFSPRNPNFRHRPPSAQANANPPSSNQNWYNFGPARHPKVNQRWHSPKHAPYPVGNQNGWRSPRPPHRPTNNQNTWDMSNISSEKSGGDQYWCETCDRGFPSNLLLEKHTQQHQKCNIDGCMFIAHPKVITKHIQMQHSTGLYKKIANLNNPEEIQKWREERKKRYPTKVNIEKKAAEIKEKIERGEKMGLKTKEMNRKSGAGDRQQRNRYDNKKIQNRGPRKFKSNATSDKNISTSTTAKPERNTAQKIINPLPVEDCKSKLKPFTGIQKMLMDDDTEDTEEPQSSLLIDDMAYEEVQNQTNTNSGAGESVVCGALSLLVGDYGSSDEDSEACDENPTTTSKAILNNSGKNITMPTNNDQSVNINENQNNTENPTTVTNSDTNITNKSDEDSGPEEVKIDKTNKTSDPKEEKPNQQSTRNQKKNQYRIESRKPTFIRQKRKIPSTLLYKLLFKEMQQERNIILQCIRHVVKNNYFEKTVKQL